MAEIRGQSAYRTVNLDNVRQNNIVGVDLREKLSETIFEQEYKEAARSIRSIISHNVKWAAKRKLESDGKKGGFESAMNRTEFQTAVPFIGDRGTGKTSMMYSVLLRLSRYDGSNEAAPFDLGEEHDSARFITLDMIDANSMKRTEDVLEIILSRIFAYLESIGGDEDFRELYRQIDSLYKDLSRVCWKQSFSSEELGLIGLKRIADSQKSIENFQKLVSDFTARISKIKYSGSQCYLVIALDDIDMYQGSNSGMRNNQFALLDQIYNYMRIPGLIVLMTYNESILKRNCLSHFRQTYYGHSTQEACSHAEREEIELLAQQFMAKLFPQEQRIYMPNFMVVGPENRPNLYVKPTINEGIKILPPFTSRDELPVKDFMLRVISHKTGVYFDAKGTKKHFFEPRNLRELGTMFQVIESMEEIPKKRNDQENVRKRNRQVLLNYLYNQFAGGRLSAEEFNRFQRLSMLPLARQGRTLVDNIRQHRMIIATKKDDLGFLEKNGKDRWRYSYGELLHNIYYATRIPRKKDAEEPYLSKDYIHCILGTHSVIMNQLFRESNPREMLMSFLGSSIAGRWANDMLPVFYVDEKKAQNYAAMGEPKFASIGSMSIPVSGFFDWEVPPAIKEVILKLQEGYMSVSEKKTLKQFIEALVLTGMLFTGFPQTGLKIQFSQKNKSEQQGLFLTSKSEDNVCFNLLNFVLNLYDADSVEGHIGYLQYIKEKLIKLGACDNILFSDRWEEILEEILGDNGEITMEVAEWKKTNKEYPVALPVQHFDMMYNIIKRLANVSYHDIPEESHVDDVFECVIRLYKDIEKELANQDEVYLTTFAKVYSTSFFYQVFTADDDNDRYNPYVKVVFNSMMKAAIPVQYSRGFLGGLM